jgi:hypothetical protein
MHTPWKVVHNWHGKIAVVDNRNNGKDVLSGRVFNLPKGKDGRGEAIAAEICRLVNTIHRED